MTRLFGLLIVLTASAVAASGRGDGGSPLALAPLDCGGATPVGTFGDASGDNTVNIIDAQQIARYSVGLPVANAAALILTGDVDGNGSINIIDAQQIARFSVALPLGPGAAARMNTAVCPVQTASTQQSVVTVSASTATTGESVTITLSAKDDAGVGLPGGGLIVVFIKQSGTSDGSMGPTADNGNGTYSATFLATTPGTPMVIGATIGGVAVTSALPSITVHVGGASAQWSSVDASPSTVAVGNTATLTVTARDAFANPLSSGGAGVAFTKGSGTSDGTISGTTDHGNGLYTATFTATTPGTPRTIGANIGGQVITNSLPSITVTPGAASPAQSIVSASASSVTSGSDVTLTLTARDGSGTAITTGGLGVAFTKGSGTSDGTISATNDLGNGSYTATFTGTTAGTPRVIGATIGGAAVTSSLPSVAVTPGAASLSQSAVSVSASAIATGTTATLMLTSRDAAGNARTTGGLAVGFTKGSGTSDGTISGTTDNGDGTYSATFTATTAGTARVIGATIGGSAVTSALPSITVSVPVMSLGTDSVTLNLQIGTSGLADPQQVGVGSVAGGSIPGLSTTVTPLTPGLCTTVAWLAGPTFDMGGVANPLSLMSISANATALPLGTCVDQVTVKSSNAAIASKTLLVVLNVGRAPAAAGVVDVVMMGNAGASSNIPQDILPTPTIELANGGRGTITGLAATVTGSTGWRDCASFDGPVGCTPWLSNGDLSLSSSQMPSVLSIASRINPFGGSATVRVTGNGMSPLTFNITVNFNTQGELVTNPRGVVLRGIAKGALVKDTVRAFNQNWANPGLTNIRIDPTTVFPAWLSAVKTAAVDTARIALTADPTAVGANTPGTVLTFNLKLLADWNDPFQSPPPILKSYTLPITFVVEGGLSTSLASATMFRAFNGAVITQDIKVNNNGSGELSALTKTVAGGAPWLTAAFVNGATTTPATLRLTANPAGLARGTYNTTVTVTSGSGATLQTRVLPVHFVVF